jgi:hypothetical protein
MSLREDLAEEIYEKYKSNTHYLVGYYSDDTIRDLLVQVQLEKYIPCQTLTLSDLSICNDSKK